MGFYWAADRRKMYCSERHMAGMGITSSAAAMCPGFHIDSARVSPRRQGKEALSQDEHRLSGTEGKVELSLDLFLNFFISALRPKGTNSGPMFHL